MRYRNFTIARIVNGLAPGFIWVIIRKDADYIAPRDLFQDFVTWMIVYALIKSKHFRRHWPFVRGIHRSPMNSPHKGQGRGALMFSLICAWTNAWANNRDAGDLRRHHAHYDVTVMNTQAKADISPSRLSFYEIMMTSSNGNIFRVAGHLCGLFTGHRWIPRTKARDAELWCFLWFQPEQTLEQTFETQMIWDAITLIMTSL